MLNIGGPELLIILLVALVVLGPDRLPGAARQVGQTVNQLRSMAQGFQSELEQAAKPDLSASGKTDPEHIRTASKSTGAEVFGGAGVANGEADSGDEGDKNSADADTAHKPVSQGGPGTTSIADEAESTEDGA